MILSNTLKKNGGELQRSKSALKKYIGDAQVVCSSAHTSLWVFKSIAPPVNVLELILPFVLCHGYKRRLRSDLIAAWKEQERTGKGSHLLLFKPVGDGDKEEFGVPQDNHQYGTLHPLSIHLCFYPGVSYAMTHAEAEPREECRLKIELVWSFKVQTRGN